MMTPIIAVIISIMSGRNHQLRLDAMVMTVGATERDRMSIVAMRGEFLFPIYGLIRYGFIYVPIYKEHN
jgi:hypothetical protein